MMLTNRIDKKSGGNAGEREQRGGAAEGRRRLGVPVARFDGRSGVGVMTPLDNCEESRKTKDLKWKGRDLLTRFACETARVTD